VVHPRLYLVTDRTRTRGRPLLDAVEAALRGGVDAVQLREKDLPGRSLHDLAVETLALCRRYGAKLFINDRTDVALAVGADGVHLPATSFDPKDARRLLGADKLIGVSTHSLAEARAAATAGANFIVFGPIFETPSKRGYGKPVGVQALRGVTRGVDVPVLAIGGVTIGNVAELQEAGAAGVAAVAAILEATDPAMAAQGFKAALRS
jgi:thiamine-phosphate pyrophosphorylase